jgi:hypothetical protein
MAVPSPAETVAHETYRQEGKEESNLPTIGSPENLAAEYQTRSPWTHDPGPATFQLQTDSSTSAYESCLGTGKGGEFQHGATESQSAKPLADVGIIDTLGQLELTNVVIHEGVYAGILSGGYYF